MKLLFDFLPIALFFGAYKFYGIYVATGVAIAVSLLQVVTHRIRHGKFEAMQLVTFFSILSLGGATLLLHNELFIKWKPTILYWVLGLIFLGSSVLKSKPIIQRLIEKNVLLPSLVWKKLNLAWCAFFFTLGAANLFVIYHYSTNVWVNFKLFGTLGCTLAFIVLQSIYISKHMIENPSSSL